MKTKHFYLCLLLLVLGTANVWADKYYCPKYYHDGNTRYTSLAELIAPGVQFMIYNTTINGEEDYTGFLYNNGTRLALDKSKDRDRYVYNENFLYTMEECDADGDGTNDSYAIKSVANGAYVGFDGVASHKTPQPLYIKDWKSAKTDWKYSDVSSEHYNYNIIDKIDLTGDNANSTNAFAISNAATKTDDSKYWGGDANAFITPADAALPFAFYKVYEETYGSYLQDLHIFSRCDVYSAQVIWGYVQNDANITVSPAGDGSNMYLLDDDLTTNVSTAGAGEHYFQFNLGEAASSIYLFMQRSSADGAVIPANVTIQASANGTDGWVTIDGNTEDANDNSFATGLATGMSFTKRISLGDSYQYIRVANAAADAQLALSEIYILPDNKKTEDAFGYFAALQEDECPVYLKGAPQHFINAIEDYNTNHPEVKTLSGVPLAGNKYRIYADAFDGTSYVNKEVSLGDDNAVAITAAGSYHNQTAGSDAAKKYEWYCEETVNGKLVFRNVYAANDGVDGDLYLANNGTVSTTPYEWTMSTFGTSRHGVPLRDKAGKYLAISNDGSWTPDITAPQHQNIIPYTKTTTSKDAEGNEVTETVTVDEGVCTDFVFIPVKVSAGIEKKITFTANEIAKRNTVFKYKDVVYNLPFSRMFIKGEELPELTLQCPTIHSYADTYVDNAEVTDLDKKPASCTDNVVSFDFDKIADGDVLDIRLTIKKPFEMGSGSLYLIQSLRKQSVAQQAPSMPRRADNVPVSPGGQVSTSQGNVYYAKFESRAESMSLVASSQDITNYDHFTAASLFYFEPTEDDAIDEYYSVNIRSAITPMKCATTEEWNESGDIWYVQPNVAGNYSGYAITLDVLKAKNEPKGWCTNHTNGDIILSYGVEDKGAAWNFVKVNDADAIKLLQDYIASVTQSVKDSIDKVEGRDEDKAKLYKAIVDGIDKNSTHENIDVATLVGLSQKIHMIEHEIGYALQPLPTVSYMEKKGESNGFESPHWYYIWNVKSEDHYARYTANHSLMALDQIADGDQDGDKDYGLEHMFYLEGRKVTETIGENQFDKVAGNALTVDEYLQVDIHNFMVPDTTVVSKNDAVVPTTLNLSPKKGKQTIASGFKLSKDQAWRISFEYELGNVSYNAHGLTLLSSYTDPAKDAYDNQFQVYLKADKSVVVKLNNGAYDTYRVYHTQDNYSKLKVVITYSISEIKFDIYNAKGEVETLIPDNPAMNDVTVLTTMLPAEGAKIKMLLMEYVKSFNWQQQDVSAGENASATTDTKDEYDTWYVLPSSNIKYPGLAIVSGGVNDNNFGWANVAGANDSIFSDAGTSDNATWQFQKILEFDDHVAQLLEKYAASDCVIYNEELARLVRLIKKNASYINAIDYDDETTYIDGHSDEYFFNEIYEAIKNYYGPMPDELKAPKPGKFYTVRPAYGDSDLRVLANEYNTMVQKNSLEEVVDGNTHRDSRIVWFFDGTEEKGFYKLDDALSLNSLHTQSNTKVFAADSVLLDDVNPKSIKLVPVGGCIVRLNDGTNNLRHKAMGDSILVGNAGTMSYGYASTVFKRTGTDDASVTATAHNEYNELVVNDENEAENPFSVTVTSNYDYKGTGSDVTEGILCPNVNGKDLNTDGSKSIELTFTYTNLPSTFTSFNSIGLHIHALNSSGSYQSNNDGVSRKWNVAVKVGADEGSLNDFGSLNEIDIAKDIEGSNKVWTVTNDNPATVEGNKLVVQLVVTSNSTLCAGCFFGLSNVILSAEGDTWYIEEIPDAEKQYIYHETKANTAGLGSLMLGYTAKIPTGISAFYPIKDNDFTDRHLTLKSYGEPQDEVRLLPASTPSIIKVADGGDKTAAYRFYYDGSVVADAADKATAADDKIVIDGSLYKKYQEVACYETADKSSDEATLIGEQCNVYMYLQTGDKLVWVYENYNADGTKTGNNDNGGHVHVAANRAYLVIGQSKVAQTASLSLRFNGSTTTGIDDITNDYIRETVNTGVKGIFDLQGRKLSEITAPGMYIVDGEKVLVE